MHTSIHIGSPCSTCLILSHIICMNMMFCWFELGVLVKKGKHQQNDHASVWHCAVCVTADRRRHSLVVLRSRIPMESRCNWKQRDNVQITGFQQIAIDYLATRTARNYLDQRSRPRQWTTTISVGCSMRPDRGVEGVGCFGCAVTGGRERQQ